MVPTTLELTTAMVMVVMQLSCGSAVFCFGHYFPLVIFLAVVGMWDVGL